MAVVAPIPNASVIAAVAANPGAFFSCRNASCSSVIRFLQPFSGCHSRVLTRGLPFQIRMNRRVVGKMVRGTSKPQYSAASVWLQAELRFVSHTTAYALAGSASLTCRQCATSVRFFIGGAAPLLRFTDFAVECGCQS